MQHLDAIIATTGSGSSKSSASARQMVYPPSRVPLAPMAPQDGNSPFGVDQVSLSEEAFEE